MSEVQTISEWWMWVAFFCFMLIMLFVDLFLLGGRKAHRVSTKEALGWVIVWITLALIFNLLLWWYLGNTASVEIANKKAIEFFTGYLIEKSLSIDNLFVFIMIFKFFSVPLEYQHRVLIFGILGAIILRLLMILLGVWMVSKFHWIFLVFGVFLIFTGFKMLFMTESKLDIAHHPILVWMRKNLNITQEYHHEKFFIKQQNTLYATPLFVVLVLIETSDLIFAIDSIPAIFAITNDPFIVFTSNIFAILGLRSLYFLLINFMDRFHLLKYGLSAILIFIGLKMLLVDVYPIPIVWTLGFVAFTLGITALLSILLAKHK